MKIMDALIIGAGPAGTSCALGLVKKGWSVGIIDKSTFPRPKTCGGFIGPENKELLTSWGIWSELLEQGACSVQESYLTASRGAFTIMPIHGEALGASRQVLDNLLMNRVKTEGVEVYEGAQIRNLYHNRKNFNVLIDHYGKNVQLNLRVRHLIDTSGHRSPSVESKNVQLGIAALFEEVPQAKNRVMLHCCRGGHVGINPFENNQVNVCYVVDSKHFEQKGRDPERIYQDWIKESVSLHRVMRGSKRVTAWKAIYIPQRKEINLFEKGVWRAGDSAAFIDTVIGGGISVALLSGQLLANALTAHSTDEERLKNYRRSYMKHLTGKRRLAAFFGGLIHRPLLAQVVISFLDQSNLIRRMAMNYSRPRVCVEKSIKDIDQERSFA